MDLRSNKTAVRERGPKHWGRAHVIVSCLAIGLFVMAPARNEFPMILVSILTFPFVQLIWPRCRIKASPALCPLNIAQIIFGTQLVLLPLLGLSFGFSRGTLPWLPSNFAINLALSVAIVAYVAFSAAFHFFSKVRKTKEQNQVPRMDANLTYPLKRMRILAVVYLSIGLLGFFFFYGSVGGFLTYMSAPSYRFEWQQSMAGTLAGAISNFFRPFLCFAVVLAWSLWIDKKSSVRRWKRATLVTALTVVALIVINAGAFSYNRMTVIGPLAALAGTFSLKVRRLSARFIALTGFALFVLALLWGEYRESNLIITDLVKPDRVSALAAGLQAEEKLQVYGAGSQFVGFLIEETGMGSDLHWGRTLVSSFLFPFPVIGQPFRETSGVTLYNTLIYGSQNVADQIIPFQGELFINFHVIGVLVGYAFLGYLFVRLEKGLRNSRNTFEVYSWIFVSIWASSLIPWSLAVASQVFLYLLWPIYVYVFINRFVRVHSVKGSHNRGIQRTNPSLPAYWSGSRERADVAAWSNLEIVKQKINAQI